MADNFLNNSGTCALQFYIRHYGTKPGRQAVAHMHRVQTNTYVLQIVLYTTAALQTCGTVSSSLLAASDNCVPYTALPSAAAAASNAPVLTRRGYYRETPQ